jgi:hypothetical protein
MNKSKIGEEKAMATVTVNRAGSAYTISQGHAIVAHMTCFTPTMPPSKTVTYTAEFPAVNATAPKAMLGTIRRDLPNGNFQIHGVLVSAETSMDITIPGGVFNGRRVTYGVHDDPITLIRMLTMKIRSLDNTGVNEVWHLGLAITELPTDVADFELEVVGGSMTIDSIDVTP